MKNCHILVLSIALILKSSLTLAGSNAQFVFDRKDQTANLINYYMPRLKLGNGNEYPLAQTTIFDPNSDEDRTERTVFLKMCANMLNEPVENFVGTSVYTDNPYADYSDAPPPLAPTAEVAVFNSATNDFDIVKLSDTPPAGTVAGDRWYERIFNFSCLEKHASALIPADNVVQTGARVTITNPQFYFKGKAYRVSFWNHDEMGFLCGMYGYDNIISAKRTIETFTNFLEGHMRPGDNGDFAYGETMIVSTGQGYLVDELVCSKPF